MRLPIIFTAFAMFTSVLHAQEPVKQQQASPSITLAKVVSDLQRKAEELTIERSAIPAVGKDGKVPLTEMDKEKSEALSAITQHLVERENLLSHKSTPSDLYYQAIQQQLHAGCHLESIRVWWKHGRKDSEYEFLAEIDQLPLMIELKKEKAAADQLVADNQPIVDSSESEEFQPLDPPIIKRIAKGNSLLDQIDEWKALSEESKSKIISR